MELGSCELLEERMRTCYDSEVSSAAFLRHCEKYRVENFRPLLACATRRDCDAFVGCMQGARRKLDPQRRWERLGELVDTLDEAVDAGRWGDAAHTCELLAADPDPEPGARATCRGLNERAVLALEAGIKALRDLPALGVTHLERCRELHHYAARVSDVAVSHAGLLCKEAQLSVDMDALAREVLRRLGEGDLRIPSRCEILVDQLKSLGTPWAERTVGALEQTCYVKTGIAILSAYPDACPANLRRLLRAMARRPEAAASLGTPLTAARARCGG